jgi:hypothetical protein
MHDDIANAACGALVFAEAKKPMIIDPSVLARSAMMPVPAGRHGASGRYDMSGYFVPNKVT